MTYMVYFSHGPRCIIFNACPISWNTTLHISNKTASGHVPWAGARYITKIYFLSPFHWPVSQEAFLFLFFYHLFYFILFYSFIYLFHLFIYLFFFLVPWIVIIATYSFLGIVQAKGETVSYVTVLSLLYKAYWLLCKALMAKAIMKSESWYSKAVTSK